MPIFTRRSLFTIAGSALSAVACKTTGGSGSSAKEEGEFDYIVVGSGAGGGPLAVNLARNGFKTLLIEAGSDQGGKQVYKIPGLHTASSEDPDMSWDYWVKHFEEDEDNKKNGNYTPGKGLLYPRAGTLGGCTAHNAMVTVYPLNRDWTEMAEFVGDAGYSPQIMRKYFQLWENADYINEPTRKKGWLNVNTVKATYAGKDTIVRSNILAASRSLKNTIHPDFAEVKDLMQKIAIQDTNEDFVGRDTAEGLVTIPLAIRNGARNSTREYILNQSGRNLTVRTNCLVSKILFTDDAVPQAIGVEYLYGKKIYKASKSPEAATSLRYKATAIREVIISAGTFNTPQLLMASGIGPAEDLKKFEKEDPTYKVRVNRPGVGHNLQDRYEIGIVNHATNPLETSARCQPPLALAGCLAEYALGKGPFTSNGIIVGVLKKSLPTMVNPDLFIFMLPATFKGYHPNYSNELGVDKRAFTWAVLKSHTQNRGGQIKLTSLDPTSMPDINFRYYQEGTDVKNVSYNGDMNAEVEDLEAVVAGIEWVRSVVNDAGNVNDSITKSQPFPAKFNDKKSTQFTETLPGPAVKTKDDIREWARRNSWGHHACGSCKMGKLDDPMAVVDSKFRVIGTKGLRIVDASVFPRIPGFFIVSCVYTISEKASDDILFDAGVPRRVQG